MSSTPQNQYSDNIPKNRTHTNANSLTRAIGSPYPEYSKIERDYHPHIRRQHRPPAGGIFSSVDYERGFFMPSSRRLQDGASRNTRVAYLIGDGRTWQFFANYQNLLGALTMCKISNAGSLRPYDLIGNPADPITFQEIHNGKLALRGDSVVAWIHPGKHTGQADNKPLHCEFVDVAFYCQNSRGVYMDTEWFDTEAEAVAFIDRTFGQEAVQ